MNNMCPKCKTALRIKKVIYEGAVFTCANKNCSNYHKDVLIVNNNGN